MKHFIQAKLPLIYQSIAYIKYYKDFLRNKKMSLAVSRMSDEELKAYDACLYKNRQGKELDWENLKTYTEKCSGRNYSIKILEKHCVQISIK